ncbi:RNA recognition motif domain and Nucleotide-binding, alpha-beta plait domain-containing protein [Strongyloides ratti]|uniref:RNA recognition motif domain and Nucleotide-binding, alpha-beta plait domain-containing protein n=1 Tax=Strongyloides ratti TaxID=34506 RepID=A0A090KWZ3_STRRB|nr:RNA recognition motif domain and Nucleotide-binding, alpha-beta plait domain-containing protein [Strongyloides ratti]CEF60392.1 RNA recognition motif domain and Nucleotide-binding, alpha-beta plait domain-containing protein [Strongyloides ratti]
MNTINNGSDQNSVDGDIIKSENITITTSSSTTDIARVPDKDYIKMFVGQIPREWNENDCRKLFEEFGDVYQVNVLRDKSSQQSRGCCFVTYYTRADALKAQGSLHNVRKLPGMQFKVQMKPADGDNRNDRKIFVGMVPKFIEADEIREHFTKFGIIEDCSILKDTCGNSRGCCFVTFSTRASAAAAIKAMNGVKLQETWPNLVVKFADVQKDKQKGTKRPASRNTISPIDNKRFNNTSNLLINNMVTQQLLQNQIQAICQQTLLTSPLLAQAQPLLLSQQANLLQNQSSLNQSNKDSISPPIKNSSNISSNNSLNALAMLQRQINPLLLSGANQLLLGMPQLGNLSNSANYAGVLNALSVPKSDVAGSTNKGDDGCNLFIYHLPQEFNDENLVQIFSKFGNLVSAKVFVDKTTNLSKCFGFVSYNNPISAQNAIQAMNGFQIGNKKLKVQLKKSKGNTGQHNSQNMTINQEANIGY